MLANLGICIKIEQLSIGKRSRWICIARWHIVNFGTLSSLIDTWWQRWRSRQRWHQSWYPLSVMVWWRWTHSFALLVCQPILCYSMWTQKKAIHVAFMRHSQVSYHCRLYLSITRKLNSPLLLFSDFEVRLLRPILHFFNSGARKPFLGHFSHIHGEVHVGLL